MHRLAPLARAVGRSTILNGRRNYFVPYKLSISQRIFAASYYGLGSLLNPNRGDFVAGFGDSLVPITALEKLREQLSLSEEGRHLLAERPLISILSLNMSKLRHLPEGTLGRDYVTFMDCHNFSPDERASVRFIQDSELAYILCRYRQVHDFFHVLFGLPTNILGELALKWLEWEVTGFPVGLLSVSIGQARLSRAERIALCRDFIPWAQRAAERCRGRLLSFRYENFLVERTEAVREMLYIEKAPFFRD